MGVGLGPDCTVDGIALPLHVWEDVILRMLGMRFVVRSGGYCAYACSACRCRIYPALMELGCLAYMSGGFALEIGICRLSDNSC